MQISHPNIERACPEQEIYDELLPLDNAVIVELGCGTGVHTRAIATTGSNRTVIAFEVDRHAHTANLAAAGPDNISFRLGGAESIDCADASADIVLMFKSLHHVPNGVLDQAMSEIRRVLRPGGMAYISEPIFAGAFNDLIRTFHDEQAVREAAFAALERAVADGRFALEREVFFNAPTHFADFAEFERRIIQATHSEHRLSAAQYADVRNRFDHHVGVRGAEFLTPMRIDLLRKPH